MTNLKIFLPGGKVYGRDLIDQKLQEIWNLHREVREFIDRGFSVDEIVEKIFGPFSRTSLPKTLGASSTAMLTAGFDFNVLLSKDRYFSIISEVIKKYASDRGAVFYPYWGTDALVKAFPCIQFIDWLYYDMGVAEISPLTIGIPRP